MHRFSGAWYPPRKAKSTPRQALALEGIEAKIVPESTNYRQDWLAAGIKYGFFGIWIVSSWRFH